MSSVTVYLKCKRSVEVQSQDVFLKDVGSLWCIDQSIHARLRAMKIYHYPAEGRKRCVISSLKLVEQMEQECPGICVEIVGEVDVLVEWIEEKHYRGWQQGLKIALVCMVSFFGTAFTIMAYHNDVGINEVFGQVYQMVMNKEPSGVNVLEISYSVGLAAGIAVFFNHVGGRRLTKEPTPIEVAMRNYEEDVDKAWIELADREGTEREVQ